jgi:hypothetical protein
LFDQFFAVTRQPHHRGVSLWKVGVEDDLPFMEKLEYQGYADTYVESGERAPRDTHTRIGIGKALVFYTPDPATDRLDLGSFHLTFAGTHIGMHTSPVIALFAEEEVARICLAADNLEYCDPRWRSETCEVLDEIGDGHPCFEVSDHPEFSLL